MKLLNKKYPIRTVILWDGSHSDVAKGEGEECDSDDDSDLEKELRNTHRHPDFGKRKIQGSYKDAF